MKIRSLAIASLFVVAITVHATLVQEKFTTDPALDGWQVYGDSSLFQWDATNQVLDVTWDSSQPDSYFYYPLGATYTQTNGFCVLFDFQLTDATASGYGNELAIGLFHFADATNTDYSRAYGTQPNLCEFDYFAPDAYGDLASDDATLIDSQANYYFPYDNITLNPGVTYHVLIIHQPGAAGISGEIFTNGRVMTTMPFLYADFPATNDAGAFQLDTLSVSSYTDDGGGDSLLAHGTLSRIAFASPLPVGLVSTTAAGQVQFASDTNWVYTLEQSTNFQTWTPAATATFGNGTNLLLQDTNPSASDSFYRVRADLP